ncbi:MAG TPA: WD40 repeat domain-containing protein [Nostocaceae cyanobacterium]|nr:WD40 repeat domain-containing protein [Nostocaceae cyanobacterium]
MSKLKLYQSTSYLLPKPVTQWKPHTELIQSIVVLPDNDTIVTCGEDSKLLISSIKQGKVIQQLPGHNLPVNTLALTPNKQYLITGADDYTVRVWNTQTWEIKYIFQEHSGFVRSVSATDTMIISGAEDRLVCVWSLTTGELLYKFTGHTSELAGVAISPGGKYAASASRDNAIWIWNLIEGKISQRLCSGGDTVINLSGGTYMGSNNSSGKGHRQHAKNLFFVKNNTHLISTSNDEVILWDLATETPTEVISPQGYHFDDVALHPDEKRLAVIVGGIQLWDYEKQQRLGLYGIEDRHRTVSFTQDGKKLISGTREGEVLIWDVSHCEPLNLGTHFSFIDQIKTAMTSEGRYLAATADYHGFIRLWNLQTGELITAIDIHPQFGDSAFAFTPSGNYLVTAEKSGKLFVWDTKTGNQCLSTNFKTFQDRYVSIDNLICLDENSALVAEYKSLEICDLTGKNQHQILISEIVCSSSILTINTDRTLAFLSASLPHPDKKYGGDINILQAWDILEKKLLWSKSANFKSEDLESTYSFSFITLSPDGNHIITKSGKSEATLTVWEAVTGKIIRDIKYPGEYVFAATFIDKNILLLFIQRERLYFLIHLDIESGKVLNTIQLEDKYYIQNAIINSDKRKITLCCTGAILILNFQGKIVANYEINTRLHTCDISPDGRYIVAGDNMGHVHFLEFS